MVGLGLDRSSRAVRVVVAGRRRGCFRRSGGATEALGRYAGSTIAPEDGDGPYGRPLVVVDKVQKRICAVVGAFPFSSSSEHGGSVACVVQCSAVQCWHGHRKNIACSRPSGGRSGRRSGQAGRRSDGRSDTDRRCPCGREGRVEVYPLHVRSRKQRGLVECRYYGIQIRYPNQCFRRPRTTSYRAAMAK